MKKFLSFCISVFLLCSLISIENITTNAEILSGVEQKLQEVVNMFPSGSVFSENGLCCDAYHGSKCSNCYYPNVVKNRLGWNWSNMYSAYSCHGFTCFVTRYIYGTEWPKNSYIVGQAKITNINDCEVLFNSARIGDIISFDGYNKDGKKRTHKAIFLRKTTGGIVVYDSNQGDDKGLCNQVKYNHTFSYDGIGQTYINATITLRRMNNYDQVEGITTPPTRATLSIDKTEMQLGEAFTLSASADIPCSYYFAIRDADSGELIDSGTMFGNYTTSFLRAGHYVARVSAYNYIGAIDSNWVDFYVFGEPPTTATLSVDKTFVPLGDSVVLSTHTDAYYVKIYIAIYNSQNELVYDGIIPYNFEFTPPAVGDYSCHISAFTNKGGADSNKVYFSVTESDEKKYPTKAELSIDKNEFNIGDVFTLTSTANKECSFYCSIFDADSGENIYGAIIPETFSLAFQRAGHYYAYMSAFNEYGGVDSNRVDFYFYGDAPTKANLTIDKDSMAVGESVNLKTSTDAYYVKIHLTVFDESGNVVFMDNIPYSYVYAPKTEGNYTAYVKTYTPSGSVESNYVSFSVGKYSVDFNGNGGENTPSSQIKFYGNALTLPMEIPTKNGYTFNGWNTHQDGSGVSYLPGENYIENENITLFAQWKCNHVYSSSITTPATCKTSGIKTYTCSVCGDSYEDDIPVNANNHAGGTEVRNSVTGNCGKSGYTGDTYCKECNTKLSSGTVIPATENHNYVGVETKAPTCKDKGIKTYTCSCGDTYTEVIEKTPEHTHNTVITAPTCTEDGYTTYICGCGDTYVSDYVDATGHDYVEVITTPATHTAEGLKTFTCDCGDSYTESIEKLEGHTYESVVTEPTCTENGFTTYTCACGDSYTDNRTEALGHNILNSVCTRCGYEIDVQVTISTVTGRPGETVKVYVSFSENTDVKTMSVSDIVYDTSKLTLVKGEWLAEDAVIENWNQNDEVGVITFAENTTLSENVFVLTFEIKEELEDCETEIDCVFGIKAMNENNVETALAVEVIPGSVQITNIIKGDINGDDYVDSNDAIHLLYHTMLPDMYEVNQSCDFDGNGYTDSNDAIYLLYYTMLPDIYPLK